jgi:restriction system protein
LLSVRVTREDLAKLDISRVDKMACLRKLGARLGTDSAAVSIYSSTPMSAIQPLRTTAEYQRISTRILRAKDSSLDLLSIDPVEFEHLIANLLVRMGLETQLTKASHDGGIDIVALDKRPILGGKLSFRPSAISALCRSLACAIFMVPCSMRVPAKPFWLLPVSLVPMPGSLPLVSRCN